MSSNNKASLKRILIIAGEKILRIPSGSSQDLKFFQRTIENRVQKYSILMKMGIHQNFDNEIEDIQSWLSMLEFYEKM